MLSLFPGLGLLDRAFEQEGFCVVRGPDLLWGGDIRLFHPPAGKFDGVIGGPPCQAFSPLKNLNPSIDKFGNMIPEFERVIYAAQPAWFLMENVRSAPEPSIPGYEVRSELLNNRWLGEEQNRVRRMSVGTRFGARLNVLTQAFEPQGWKATVTAAHGGERRTPFNKGTGGAIQRYTVEEALQAQGLPMDFFAHSPLTRAGQLRGLAQGVPIQMGRAVARAVRTALGVPTANRTAVQAEEAQR